MLAVCSPLQIETTSSFPFYTEMRSTHSSTPTSQRLQEQPEESSHQDHPSPSSPSSPAPSSQSSADWAAAPSSTSTTLSTNDSLARNDPPTSGTTSVKQEAMVPSQSQVAQQPMYQPPFYPTEYDASKPMSPVAGSSERYMDQGMYANHQNVSPYTQNTRATLHERRQSILNGQQNVESNSADDITAAVSSIAISQSSTAAWDPATAHLHLPPISEALHRIFPHQNTITDGADSIQTMQPRMPMTTMENSPMGVPAPAGFYAQVPFAEMPPVNMYPTQDQYSNDPSKMPTNNLLRNPSPVHSMMAPNSGVNVHQGYGRRVTYPFVPSIDTSSGLLMANLTSPENSGSSPLMNSPFAHGGLVGVSPVPGQGGIVRSSPIVGYMDAMSLQHQPMPPHQSSYQHPLQHLQQTSTTHSQQTVAWQPEGDMTHADNGQNNSKVYSFVPLSGVNSKKRPRRRFDEIERLYVCNWSDCEKAYGTLNHLNAHVNMQKHGPKRHPSEFKELRKAWRRHKRAEEEAAKQAAAFHQQQNQTQLQMCDPVLSNMGGHPHAHAHAHSMALHTMSHHQPHQLPLPHAHPNQHSHHQQQQHHQHQHSQHSHPHAQHHHHHPLGF